LHIDYFIFLYYLCIVGESGNSGPFGGIGDSATFEFGLDDSPRFSNWFLWSFPFLEKSRINLYLHVDVCFTIMVRFADLKNNSSAWSRAMIGATIPAN